jgi:hypothetical protein
MGDCAKVDSGHSFKYYNAEAEIIAEQPVRLSHFLDRHDMGQKFLDEDAAGQR